MIPNFLVIGAQKAGTTWLDRNLRMHPEIWLPPEKEIHYFDLPKNLPFTFFVLAPDRSDRSWVINRLKRAYRRSQFKPENTRWLARYYFLPRTDRWYSSLFTPGPGQIAGEVTPHYAAMAERNIAKIKSLAPEMKLVYILRDPIDRMWSHAAMNFSDRFGYEGIDAVAEQTLARFLRSPKHLAQARYFANLQRWEQYFSPEQMFIGFYDEIAAAPKRLLTSIFRFLGVDPSEEHISARAEQVIFGRDYPPIPPHLAAPVAEALIDDMENLHQRLGSPYTAAWLASMQGHLAQ